MEYDLENFRRKTSSLEARMKDVNEMTDKIFQYESRLSKLNSQAEQFAREREEFTRLGQEN